MNDTHYIPPAGSDRTFSRAVRWLADRGVNLAGAETLTVVGRVSGQPQRVPVNPLTFDGGEYLVAVRGEAQWVRNARAAATAELRRGRKRRTVALHEIEAAQRVPVLRAYLKKWGWEVKRFLPEGLTVDATDEELAAHAHQLPVFAIAG
ncbi:MULTISPECIES: nitroreductase/quinone reductase family protein [unclassified Gordonia (in: high G+C Gram-positive bacteria)]|uniref:nitroreductase/quinone reductase family protein n=1 Tax=unclassified Gordonia (in: high G+C Gram-positive bacteria) TaxID=2657482 RepID=UPI001F116D16|nr:nitroreductase/quinone reductase family protein [Gordonia sp. ABSL49_1]MCH5641567.1 nitroreductase/quinone reductase family protein [Gordonia sp. ABSL49_1]